MHSFQPLVTTIVSFDSTMNRCMWNSSSSIYTPSPATTTTTTTSTTTSSNKRNTNHWNVTTSFCIRWYQNSCHLSIAESTVPKFMPMKPGTPLLGLDIFATPPKDPKDGESGGGVSNNQGVVVAKERHEYPEWISTLSKPNLSLAKLRRMDEKDATEADLKRYLKLTRRVKIKNEHEIRSKK